MTWLPRGFLWALALSVLMVSPGIVYIWRTEPLPPKAVLDLAFPTVAPRLAVRITPTPIPRPTFAPPVIAAAVANVQTFNAPPEVTMLLEEYAKAYSIDVALLHRIARCESGYNATSVSASGTYAGMFQFSDSTWRSTRRAMGLNEDPTLRMDAREAIHTATFKLANGGAQAWKACL